VSNDCGTHISLTHCASLCTGQNSLGYDLKLLSAGQVEAEADMLTERMRHMIDDVLPGGVLPDDPRHGLVSSKNTVVLLVLLEPLQR